MLVQNFLKLSKGQTTHRLVSMAIWPTDHQFATSGAMYKYAQNQSFAYSRHQKYLLSQIEHYQASELQNLIFKCITFIFSLFNFSSQIKLILDIFSYVS